MSNSGYLWKSHAFSFLFTDAIKPAWSFNHATFLDSIFFPNLKGNRYDLIEPLLWPLKTKACSSNRFQPRSCLHSGKLILRKCWHCGLVSDAVLMVDKGGHWFDFILGQSYQHVDMVNCFCYWMARFTLFRRVAYSARSCSYQLLQTAFSWPYTGHQCHYLASGCKGFKGPGALILGEKLGLPPWESQDTITPICEVTQQVIEPRLQSWFACKCGATNLEQESKKGAGIWGATKTPKSVRKIKPISV